MIPGAISENGKRRIYRVLCNVAGSDGEIGGVERDLLQRVAVFFGLGAEEAEKLERKGLAKKGLRVGKSPTERDYLVKALIEIAAADGQLSKRQEKRLYAVAKLIGLPEADLHKRLKDRFQPPRG